MHGAKPALKLYLDLVNLANLLIHVMDHLSSSI